MFLVNLFQSGSPGVGFVCLQRLNLQVPERKKWEPNAGFRPVRKDGSHAVEENVAWVKVVVNEGIRNTECLYSSRGLFDETSKFI